MNYWIFKVNPDDYDIDGHLAYHDKRITWRAQNHEKKIKKGDIAFIWRTGNNRGIIGIMDIDSNPAMRRMFEHEKQFCKTSFPEFEFMINGRFRDVPVNLPYQVLKEIHETSDLSIFSTSTKREFSVGTNYRVTKEEGEAILNLVANQENHNANS